MCVLIGGGGTLSLLLMRRRQWNGLYGKVPKMDDRAKEAVHQVLIIAFRCHSGGGNGF